MPEPCADCRTPVPPGFYRCDTCTTYLLASMPPPPSLDDIRTLVAQLAPKRAAKDDAFYARRAARLRGEL